jgi:hypothetical protein
VLTEVNDPAAIEEAYGIADALICYQEDLPGPRLLGVEDSKDSIAVAVFLDFLSIQECAAIHEAFLLVEGALPITGVLIGSHEHVKEVDAPLVFSTDGATDSLQVLARWSVPGAVTSMSLHSFPFLLFSQDRRRWILFNEHEDYSVVYGSRDFVWKALGDDLPSAVMRFETMQQTALKVGEARGPRSWIANLNQDLI